MRDLTDAPAVASEEGDSQVRLRGYTDRLQTPRICSEMAAEFSLSSREDGIRDQRVLRNCKEALLLTPESSGQLYPPGGTKTMLDFSNTGEEQGLDFLMMVAD